MKILKNIKNILSPSAKAEQRQLESWKEEYIQQLKSLENAVNNDRHTLKWQNYKDYKPEEAWKKFEEKLNINHVPEKSGHPLRVFLLSAAAALALVLGFWWLFGVSDANNFPLKFQAGNSSLELSLADKSTVVLDSFSDLEQTAYRHVLLSGRAYFKVARDTVNQFVISTKEASVTVLGTAFHVTAKNGKTRVDVIEGLVKISLDNKFLLCSAGQSAEVSNGNILLLKERKNIISDWKNNVLIFDNVHIEEVIKTIAHHYQLDLRLENEAPGKDCFLKTKFINAGIQSVLKEISMIARLDFSLQNNVLTVTRMGC